jgi:hypothetical protein
MQRASPPPTPIDRPLALPSMGSGKERERKRARNLSPRHVLIPRHQDPDRQSGARDSPGVPGARRCTMTHVPQIPGSSAESSPGGDASPRFRSHGNLGGRRCRLYSLALPQRHRAGECRSPSQARASGLCISSTCCGSARRKPRVVSGDERPRCRRFPD